MTTPSSDKPAKTAEVMYTFLGLDLDEIQGGLEPTFLMFATSLAVEMKLGFNAHFNQMTLMWEVRVHGEESKVNDWLVAVKGRYEDKQV